MENHKFELTSAQAEVLFACINKAPIARELTDPLVQTLYKQYQAQQEIPKEEK